MKLLCRPLNDAKMMPNRTQRKTEVADDVRMLLVLACLSQCSLEPIGLSLGFRVVSLGMNWKPTPRRPPIGWGLTSLTDAFNSARDNQWATFDNKPAARDLLVIDRILFELLDGRSDPDPMQPLQFLMRAHSCFRAASACAMAGQVYESTVLHRAVLETAAYGLYIGHDNLRGELWLRRSDSKGAKEKVREAFSFGSLRRDFKLRHPDLEPAFSSLYENLVDFGAHPNEAGFSISTAVRRVDGGRTIDTVYLHDDDGPALDFGMKNTARVGLWIILVFRAIYPALYDDPELDFIVNELLRRH